MELGLLYVGIGYLAAAWIAWVLLEAMPDDAYLTFVGERPRWAIALVWPLLCCFFLAMLLLYAIFCVCCHDSVEWVITSTRQLGQALGRSLGWRS